ncbi:hypothetical protein SpCBS45565_g02897 [Spizellomyces sp. 'palustris']|nr:hypothetical protein SpCBS45565_g02897 [Spizellomyces sp. 'palustris']
MERINVETIVEDEKHEKADLNAIYGQILTRLRDRRKNPPSLSIQKPPLQSYASTTTPVLPLVHEIDSYITYIQRTTANIAEENFEVAVNNINIHIPVQRIRIEHLKAHKRARGRWWEIPDDDADEWEFDMAEAAD